jgi:hypothetical protein
MLRKGQTAKPEDALTPEEEIKDPVVLEPHRATQASALARVREGVRRGIVVCHSAHDLMERGWADHVASRTKVGVVRIAALKPAAWYLAPSFSRGNQGGICSKTS